MTLYPLAPWRIRSTAHDGTVNDTYCDLWLDDRLSPLSASTQIGDSLNALCGPRSDGSIECTPERPGPYAGYTATRLPDDYDGEPEADVHVVDSAFEAGPMGRMRRLDGVCRCGCQQVRSASDDPYWLDAQHPSIHERWELGVRLSGETRQAIGDGEIPMVRPGIIRISDLCVRIDGYHDQTLPGMTERNALALCHGRELHMSAPDAATSYLAVRDLRAISILIPSEEALWQRGQAGHEDAVPDTVRSLWVANTWRGKGVAEELMAAFHDPFEADWRRTERAEVLGKLRLFRQS